MTGLKRGMAAAELKSRQEEMQKEVTDLQDIFLKLKSEMQILVKQWKGDAADEFQMAFWDGWNAMWEDIKSLTEVIGELSRIESEIEKTEKQVEQVIVLGG